MSKRIKGGDISNLSDKISRRKADLDFFKQQLGYAGPDEKDIIERQMESLQNKIRPLEKYKNRKQDINMFQGMAREYPSNMDIQRKIQELEMENAMLETEILGRPVTNASDLQSLSSVQPPTTNMDRMGRPQPMASSLLPSAPPAYQVTHGYQPSAPPAYQASAPPAYQASPPPAYQQPVVQQAPVKPNIKVLFTDLDNTLITNVDNQARDRYEYYKVERFSETNFEHGNAVPDIDIVTTEGILDFLHKVSLNENIFWFIISAGRNDNKLADLLDFARRKGKPLYYRNAGSEFGLKDKKRAVSEILGNLSRDYTIEKSLFIDDEEDKLLSVNELPNIRVLPVESEYYRLLDWWSPIMMTPKNVDQAERFLGLRV